MNDRPVTTTLPSVWTVAFLASRRYLQLMLFLLVNLTLIWTHLLA